VAESFIAVGAKNAHTWQRLVGATNVEDEFTLPGEFPLASYTAYAVSVSGATAASHAMQIMAGAALNVRIRRIMIHGEAATAGTVRFEIMRLTTAGTGGTVITPSKLDNGDPAAGFTVMTLPTVKGTEGAAVWPITVGEAAAAPQTSANSDGWVQHPYSKPLIIPAGIANGITLKVTGAIAATLFDIAIEGVETSFL
jgi:hypothetical protein